MGEELTPHQLTQYPIHRCSISQVTVYAECPGCRYMMQKKVNLNDELPPAHPVVTCKECKRSWLIKFNIDTSIRHGDTTLIRVNL